MYQNYTVKNLPHVLQRQDLPLAGDSVVAIGNFDGMHIGHQALLARLAEEGRARNASPLVFTFTENPMVLYFGAKYICGDADRMEALADLGVEAVYRGEYAYLRDFTCEEFVRDFLIAKLHCVCAVVGSDFRFGKGRMGSPETMKELMERYGGSCVILPAVEREGKKVSSNYIRRLLGEGKLDLVEALLGRPYSAILTVREGRKLGRTIGCPTINQLPGEDRMLPKFGAYLSVAEFLQDGKPVRFYGLTNVGVKPTVSSESKPVFETHILDFDGDLYGVQVKITLLRFLRKERCFNSLEDLRAQIDEDIAEARKELGR